MKRRPLSLVSRLGLDQVGRGGSSGAPGTPPRPGRLRLFAALLFLIPGSLLVLVGVALCWPWLRRYSAAPRSTREVGEPRLGQSAAVGTPVTGSTKPSGAQRVPSEHWPVGRGPWFVVPEREA
jgi:UPF0716 family protein affecting phage T7 exclusion